MATGIQYRSARTHHSLHNTGSTSFKNLADGLLALIHTALMCGILWGVGYLLYLLFLNEMR